MLAPAFAGADPSPAAWGVAALLLATADALAARFGAVTVRGELSAFARAGSGHCYFTLKDSSGAPALLRCAMFRRHAMLLNFQPAEGMKVELRGRLAVYEARGELQMVVESLQRLGQGTLFEEFLRLRERLAAQGLFDTARKRALPPYPQRLGVVTSPAAAALHDVLAALARRAPQVGVVLYPSPVQGSEAPAALAAAIDTAGQRREVDVLLVVRGGGSLEDLWAFNDERVLRAIVACPLPVVCGVGHESDITLADLAADLRAPTPTAAAELAAPAQAELLQALQQRAATLLRASERHRQGLAQRLDHLALQLRQPGTRLLAHGARLDALAVASQRAVQVALAARQQALALRQAQLDALDPQQVLQRGYAWVEDSAGRAIARASAVQPGQAVRAVWADGSATARIDTVNPTDPRLPEHRPPAGAA